VKELNILKEGRKRKDTTYWVGALFRIQRKAKKLYEKKL